MKTTVAMQRALITISLAGIALSTYAGESAQNADWKPVKQSNGVAIYSRAHPGSKLKEFKAMGEIDAPTDAVHNVINDVDAYPSFMPYMAECRLLERNGDSIVTYQRLSPKIVGDRDYTLHVERKSWRTENGMAYLDRWEPANERGPAEKPGVFRVKFCDGSWLLEPTGSNKTLATYSVFSDSGIKVPAFLANAISETGIAKLFAAVQMQVKNPKYQTK